MVKYVIAIACVSVLIPSTTIAQQRTANSKAASQPGRAPAGAQKTAAGGRAVLPVSKAGAAKTSPQTEIQSATPGNAAQMEMKGIPAAQQRAEMSPELRREMDRLLQFWSDASEGVKRLEGKHLRIVYDLEFEVERNSSGEFAFESPDKGRIDLTPTEITPAVVAAREKEAKAAIAENRRARCRTKKNGEPFELAPSQLEIWSCDGQRVYSLDVEKKEAQVAQLPADMQGEHIMHSPLPFLFGMKPEEAKRRFNISFKDDKFDPRTGIARLVILPRLPQDAYSWQKADLILDLKEFLPVAVQLLDPPGTKITVFQFSNFVKNEKDWKLRLKGENPKTRFTPDTRDYTIHVIPTAGQPASPGGAPAPEMEVAKPATGEKLLINVVGQLHTDAVIQLERQGLVRDKGEANQIFLEPGAPAKKKDDVYRVISQDPPAGSPFTPDMKVKLTLFDDPNRAKQ